MYGSDFTSSTHNYIKIGDVNLSVQIWQNEGINNQLIAFDCDLVSLFFP